MNSFEDRVGLRSLGATVLAILISSTVGCQSAVESNSKDETRSGDQSTANTNADDDREVEFSTLVDDGNESEPTGEYTDEEIDDLAQDAPPAGSVLMPVTDGEGNSGVYSILAEPVSPLAPDTWSFAIQPVDPIKRQRYAYAWDFGDSTRKAIGTRTSHVFAEPGEYEVTLSAHEFAAPAGGLSNFNTELGDLAFELQFTINVEALDLSECDEDADCDDGLFCNGAEACVEGQCVSADGPCGDDQCDEDTDSCVAEEDPSGPPIGGGGGGAGGGGCTTDAECDDGDFCNGAEVCVAGACTDGELPCPTSGCNETTDACSDVLIAVGDQWHYQKGLSGTPPVGWANTFFNDGSWLVGPTGIGYGDGDDATVLDDMAGSYVTVYARRKFDIPEGASVSNLNLVIDYDDAFVAYLNGTEVVRRNIGAPGSPVNRGTEADSGREAGVAEEINLSVAGLLLNGTNTLAIEIHNFNIESSDLTLIPSLFVADAVTCSTDADCDDGAFCNGSESCVNGACQAGTAPCDAAQCDEAGDFCLECDSNLDCDDGVFCNGTETCDQGRCLDGTPPCSEELCDEANEFCGECSQDSDCDDGAFCNGVESCNAGSCVPGVAPCDDASLCNEGTDRCDECGNDADCDDGLFCNGSERCSNGTCSAGVAPCGSDLCSEERDNCDECGSDADCDDGLFCNGAEYCEAGVCMAGSIPCDDDSACNEATNACDTESNDGGFSEDFDGLSDGSDPANWFDTGANNSLSQNNGLFKVQTASGNKVLGTTSTQTNIHSHYVGDGSANWTAYAFSGRMRATSSTGGVGVTFLSDFPNSDTYYRLREWGGGTFHISPHGTDISGGETDSGVSLTAGTWFHFVVEVEDNGSRTDIRVKVWADGTNEPNNWQINCYDDRGTRITHGTVGVWAMGAGDKQWDDFGVTFFNCDEDSDNDGEPNCSDGCPNDASKQSEGQCGCGIADTDSDGDGVANCLDQCPGQADVDSDGDDTLDCEDGCPNDAEKTEPGVCGCGTSDVDSDEDGVPDCNDVCPGFDDNVDTDNNGTPDGCQPCGSNADCDDGLFCNGAEVCQSGSCVAGSLPCDSDEFCNEATDSCDADGWQAPIGIPEPSFGVRETVANTYGNDSFYTHWVDRTHSSATDSNNPNGSPSKPRVTIPTNLPAGSVVELRGGPYNYSSGGDLPMSANGTAQQPVFIRGPRSGARPVVSRSVNFGGQYLIVENIEFDGANGLFTDNGDHHIAVRNSEFIGGGGAGILIISWDGSTLHDIVISNCVIRDWGDWQANFDEDYHGINVGHKTNNIWLLDNELYHNSGDGVQINGGQGGWSSTHHIYLGRNEAWQNKQTGFWAKQSSHVVMSENIAHGNTPSDSSLHAAGMGGQYDPNPIWFLYNEIYDCDTGFAQMSGDGGGGNSYYIGNVIHDLHDSNNDFNPGSAWSNAAFTLIGTNNRYVINNTAYNVPAGINGPATYGSYVIANNIISNINEPGGRHVMLEYPGAVNNSSMTNCLFYQNGSAVDIQWANSYPQSTNFTGSFSANPMFVSPNADNFALQPSSPAIGAGSSSAEESVYSTFESLYGLSIRPNRATVDIGAPY
ncbi:MAG TPA: PKD domain-containing protein [Phycisphaerae bacterium]|nr:PKD domain-containing protein [Phycisphaerae bacterium]